MGGSRFLKVEKSLYVYSYSISGFVDREFWIEAGKMGLIGVEQSVEKGGWGKDFYTNIIGLEEQVYSGCPGGFAIQNDLVMI